MLISVRLALVAVTAAVVAGCSAFAPITTSLDYSAPDGTQVATESVLAHNLVLVTTGEGEPAVLLGSLTNRATASATVDVSWDGGQVSVHVGAGQTVQLHPDHQEVRGTAPAIPGLFVTVSLSAEGETGEGPVPIMDGTLPHYVEVVQTLAGATD